MTKKNAQSVWGNHWPSAGEALLKPVFKNFGFSHLSTDVVSGMIIWSQRFSSGLTQEIYVNPYSTSDPNTLRFAARIFVQCDEIVKVLLAAGWKFNDPPVHLANLATITLSWLVRRSQSDKSRTWWDVDVSNPAMGVENFQSEFEKFVQPIALKLRDETELVQFMLGADAFGSSPPGGPFWRTADALKISVLHFRAGRMQDALLSLDEYRRTLDAEEHRRFKGPNERDQLEARLKKHDDEVGLLRTHYSGKTQAQR